MFRKIVASFAVLVVLALSVPYTSQAQDAPSFVGKWSLVVQLPGVPFAFNYEVVAQGAPADDPRGVGTTTRHGTGTVTGLLDFCPACRVVGVAWRHTPLTGAMPTGVTLSYEAPSGSSPSSFNLRGTFMTADRIEGTAINIGDGTDSANADYDAKIGYVVTKGTFVMTRQP
jgi:hypothetical protein